MELLTWFGLAAVGAMLLFYALEDRSPAFILAFAGACVSASVYGFLIDKGWPFGIVEGAWSLVAFRRWLKVRRLVAVGRKHDAPDAA